ncbi:MAG: DUF2889 domain-containing protein [Gammaproteobacteria bacterium]|nr:DUF2889 domain-containing protein [Gammaproteobacteria bacterium]MDH3449237.1 DUF2889 domain-containing protein [Gammaproteobacteria bacterium]
MGLPAAATREKKHRRRIDCEGFLRSDGLWDIDVHMVDTRSYDCTYDEFHRDGLIMAGEPVHDMWLRFTIDLDFLIHDVQAASDHTPFSICPAAAGPMRDLVGLRIGPGWLKQARERIGTDRSCTHLMDLLGQLAATAYQTLHAAIEEREARQPGRARPPILDTCLALSSSGDVVKNLWPEFYQPKRSEEHES